MKKARNLVTGFLTVLCYLLALLALAADLASSPHYFELLTIASAVSILAIGCGVVSIIRSKSRGVIIGTALPMLMAVLILIDAIPRAIYWWPIEAPLRRIESVAKHCPQDKVVWNKSSRILTACELTLAFKPSFLDCSSVDYGARRPAIMCLMKDGTMAGGPEAIAEMWNKARKVK